MITSRRASSVTRQTQLQRASDAASGGAGRRQPLCAHQRTGRTLAEQERSSGAFSASCNGVRPSARRREQPSAARAARCMAQLARHRGSCGGARAQRSVHNATRRLARSQRRHNCARPHAESPLAVGRRRGASRGAPRDHPHATCSRSVNHLSATSGVRSGSTRPLSDAVASASLCCAR